MHWGILGALEVRAGDRPVDLGGPKQRAVLAFLLVHVNEVVALDRLIDGLWGEHPPRTAKTSLQNTVAQLRKLLGVDDRPLWEQYIGYSRDQIIGTTIYDRLPKSQADAIVAMDMDTGKVKWVYQTTPNDVWLGGCGPRGGGKRQQ